MKIKLLATTSAALLLTACSSQLTDVNHKWCPPEPTVTQPTIESVALSADALFAFSKSEEKDLLKKGHQSLTELAEKISTNFATVDSIHLTGHTDRLGSEKANYKLGLNRANTVKAYLQKQGVTAPISTSSAGESQPVTTNCVGNKATAELTACLQADRRVTVDIKGVKKGN